MSDTAAGTIGSMDDATAAALAELATGIARRLLESRHDVEEVAQEATARLVANWDRVHDYARPWIVRVATNLAIERLRHDRRFSTESPVEPQMSVEAPSDLRLDLRRGVGRLPTRQRQAVVLRYLCDFSEADVASLLGCSQGAVKRHLHRAVTALRASPDIEGMHPGDRRRIEEESVKIPTWRELGFVPATEPATGWPPRPWDHWHVRGPDGSWDRVAVDPSGAVILDADGDEVQSGPGFDHEVVKVTPGTDPDHTPPPFPDLDGFTDEVAGLLYDAADDAAFHGHPWVGDEHLALALARRGNFPGPAAVVTVDNLDPAIAQFYEGPWADQRVGVVRGRRNGEPFVRQPDEAQWWTHALEQTLAAARSRAGGGPAGPREVAVALLAKQQSLPVTLLREAGHDVGGIERAE